MAGLASKPKHSELKSLGADALLPRNPDNLKEALNNTIGRDTVSVVADVVGGPLFTSLIDCLERGGRYTCSGAIGGPIVSLDIRTLYLNDLTFTGSTVIAPEIFTDVVGYIEREEIKPLLAASYPLENMREAQQAFNDKKHSGNIVITIAD